MWASPATPFFSSVSFITPNYFGIGCRRRLPHLRCLALDEGSKLPAFEDAFPSEQPEELNYLRHPPRPSRLVTRPQSCAVIAMEVFMEQNVVAPVRVGLELLGAAVDRPRAFFVTQEDAGEPVGDLLGDLEEVHQLA